MTDDNTFELISISEILGFLRRRSLLILLSILAGAVAGFQGSGYIPKMYKAKATATIQSGYFHHPLVSDTVAEIQDPSEMSAHRLALIRAALSDQFLRDFNNTFLSSKEGSSSSTNSIDLEAVLKKIEYFSTNPTSFQVSVSLHSPEQAFLATQRVLAQILSTLKDEREALLVRSKHALEHEAELLLGTFPLGANKPEGEDAEAQLASARAQLAGLEEHLSATHPDVISLKNRLQQLQARQQEAAPSLSDTPGISSIFYAPETTTPKHEIVAELLTKICHLNIVLTMERDQPTSSYIDVIEHPRIPVVPFAPKRSQFAIIGGVTGLALSLAIAVARELRRRSTMSPLDAAQFLELPLLGEFPSLAKDDQAPSSRLPSRIIRLLGVVMVMGLCRAG